MKKNLLVSALAVGALFAPKAEAFDLRPYLGVYSGYRFLDTDAPEADKKGFTVGGKGVVSLEMRSWFLDFAGGYEYEKLYGNNDVDLRTDALFGEIDARVKFNDVVSFGPVASYHFDTASRRAEGGQDRDSHMWMAGAKLMFQNGVEARIPVRLEIALKKSIQGLDGRDLYAANVGLQFGFPRAKKQEYVPQPPPPPPVEETVVVYAPTVIYTEESEPDVMVSLNAGSAAQFKTNKYQVTGAQKESLEDLAEYLVANPEAYQEIHVAGHTDRTGKLSYNQMLSEKRAEAVKMVLVDAGVPEERIKTKGYGPDRPLDEGRNAKAYAKNRRTEIKFFGVKDKDALQAEVDKSMTE